MPRGLGNKYDYRSPFGATVGEAHRITRILDERTFLPRRKEVSQLQMFSSNPARGGGGQECRLHQTIKTLRTWRIFCSRDFLRFFPRVCVRWTGVFVRLSRMSGNTYPGMVKTENAPEEWKFVRQVFNARVPFAMRKYLKRITPDECYHEYRKGN